MRVRHYKPEFKSVPLADGLRWRGGGGWRYEEKKDGVWCERALGGSVVVGELCRDGRFWVFDAPVWEGQDVRREKLSDRLELLAGLALPAGWERIPHGSGGEFLEAVLAAGGEGIVAKHLDSRFGFNWIKCKRVETHDVVVTERHGEKRSVRLGDRGWCSVIGKSFESIRVGDVVEVACHSIHLSGRFREPRLVRVRRDKAAV